jgi:hypothetical protein
MGDMAYLRVLTRKWIEARGNYRKLHRDNPKVESLGGIRINDQEKLQINKSTPNTCEKHAIRPDGASNWANEGFERKAR